MNASQMALVDGHVWREGARGLNAYLRLFYTNYKRHRLMPLRTSMIVYLSLFLRGKEKPRFIVPDHGVHLYSLQNSHERLLCSAGSCIRKACRTRNHPSPPSSDLSPIGPDECAIVSCLL